MIKAEKHRSGGNNITRNVCVGNRAWLRFQNFQETMKSLILQERKLFK